ncbi:hypothetical protein C0Q70_13180 [Pomacea canaliculata]|uniref:Uncharacterized protein n=1 Tax=Pomacea canaliculata TaxID=400727 RepID=A0A2T7NWI8_POMCA|nr:hypothetical protein C0Q70_13180 [Pomacea canaliculata]
MTDVGCRYPGRPSQTCICQRGSSDAELHDPGFENSRRGCHGRRGWWRTHRGGGEGVVRRLECGGQTRGSVIRLTVFAALSACPRRSGPLVRFVSELGLAAVINKDINKEKYRFVILCVCD